MSKFKNKIHEIAAALQMIGAIRYVNIRGYVREVRVSHKDRKSGEWIVIDGKNRESVPEHLFYHNDLGGLILRDGIEFRRRFPDHQVEIPNLPTIWP